MKSAMWPAGGGLSGTAALLLLFLSGCASIDSRPFHDFQSSLEQGREAMDGALELGGEWVKSADIRSFRGPLHQWIIQPGDGYDWTLEPMPLYLRIRQARRTIGELNRGMQEYAGLLAKLADSRVDDPAAFEAMAKQMNQNAASAAAAFKWCPPREGIPILSAAAVEAARHSIRGRRVEALETIIRDDQPLVEKYAAHCIALVRLLRDTLKTRYVDHYEPIQAAGRSASAGSRASFVEAMVSLNDRFLDLLETLERIEKVYAALPPAHEDLAHAVRSSKPSPDWPGLQRLADEGRQLQRLYDELKPKD